MVQTLSSTLRSKILYKVYLYRTSKWKLKEDVIGSNIMNIRMSA